MVPFLAGYAQRTLRIRIVQGAYKDLSKRLSSQTSVSESANAMSGIISDVPNFAPIDLIRQVSAKNTNSVLFKFATQANGVWEDITYAQFFADVERVASHTLCQKSWPKESVVGIWTSGITYLDVVHIFAIMRAGYVPHLLYTMLSNTSNGIILDLLNESNAHALFLDPSLLKNDFSKFEFCELFTIKDMNDYPDEINQDLLPPIPTEISPEQTVLIMNTSGSSGGRCKLVRHYFRVFETIMRKRKYILDISRGNAPLRTPQIGSFCHCAQITEFFMVITFAGTLILLEPSYNSSTLLRMYQECHLTALGRFTLPFQTHLKDSRKDKFLLSALKSMDEVSIMGVALPEEEVEWITTNKIPLVNIFGSTECGIILVAWRENPTHFVPLGLDGLYHEFRSLSDTGDRDIETTFTDKMHTFKELVILSNSADCPDPIFRSKIDGHFHTGDVFEEVGKGYYRYKGRLDDSIKMKNGGTCDTISIENHVRKNCGDVVHACVVIGVQRPSPTLLVEPKIDNYDEEKLISLIEHHFLVYNVNVYKHEKITRGHIIVVPKGSLPRTQKGNIRRNVSEQIFSQRLNELYGPIPAA